jgi:hypothetical protein
LGVVKSIRNGDKLSDDPILHLADREVICGYKVAP